MDIYGIPESSKSSPRLYYMMASITGIALFIIMLITFYIGTWIFKILIRYWIIIVLIIFGFMLIKRVFVKRKVKKIEYSD